VTPADPLAAQAVPIGDRGFLILAAFIGLVTLCAVGFVLASLMLRGRNNRIARQWAALEARWDPVMLEVLAGAADPAVLHAIVRSGEHTWFVEYLLRYGRRIRGPERALLSTLAMPYLYAVSGDLGHPSVERRARAAQSVGDLGGGAYRAELLAALEDRAPLVVMIAAVALSRVYRPDDVRRVIGSVARLGLLTNRLLASMLQRLGPESAWAFREVLADRGRPAKLRTVAAKVLAAFNDQEAGANAVSALTDAVDVDLRVAILDILQRIGSAEHLPIVRRLAGDPEPAVRGAAIRILSRAGEEEDLDLLVGALDDPVAWVAIHAAEGLRRSGRPELLARLAAAQQRRSSVIVSAMVLGDAGA
jgi:HEAT repeat protein